MNNSLSRPQPDLQEIIERTEKELQNSHRTPFSDQALGRLKEEIAAYAVELINESVKRAKRHQAEGVSPRTYNRQLSTWYPAQVIRCIAMLELVEACYWEQPYLIRCR